MDWAAYAETWPNAGASRFAHVRPHRWHLQRMGPADAPAVLLLHGLGGATHSWRDLAPRLARRWQVIAPDLPGHGFTRLGALQRSSPDLMAADLETLLAAEDLRPAAIIGHSAGGALALRMAQRATTPPAAVVGLNAALEDFEGQAGWLFPMMARALAMNPFVAPTVSRLAGSARSVQGLIDATGSQLDALGLALYRACLSDARHVDGALTMMAQWRLRGMRSALPRTGVPVLLLAGDRDRAVSPETAERARARLPLGEAMRLDGLGHLAHEEAPDEIAARIDRFLDRHL